MARPENLKAFMEDKSFGIILTGSIDQTQDPKDKEENGRGIEAHFTVFGNEDSVVNLLRAAMQTHPIIKKMVLLAMLEEVEEEPLNSKIINFETGTN